MCQFWSFILHKLIFISTMFWVHHLSFSVHLYHWFPSQANGSFSSPCIIIIVAAFPYSRTCVCPCLACTLYNPRVFLACITHRVCTLQFSVWRPCVSTLCISFGARWVPALVLLRTANKEHVSPGKQVSLFLSAPAMPQSTRRHSIYCSNDTLFSITFPSRLEPFNVVLVILLKH